MAVFGIDWSIIRRDDSILSHSTSFEASNSAFLAVASWSGISQHGSFERVNCPVAWEFFSCSALLTFLVLAVLMFGTLLFFAATGEVICTVFLGFSKSFCSILTYRLMLFLFLLGLFALGF